MLDRQAGRRRMMIGSSSPQSSARSGIVAVVVGMREDGEGGRLPLINNT